MPYCTELIGRIKLCDAQDLVASLIDNEKLDPREVDNHLPWIYDYGEEVMRSQDIYGELKWEIPNERL